ncbi:MAG: putative DNA-binding domain-containing protein [Acidobacteriaceae bacterium]
MSDQHNHPTSLREIQQRMAASIMQPITREERMRRRRADGTSSLHEAEAIISPNDRLSSFERLEIYNRQYWFRLYTSFQEDFPGLQAVVGTRRFERIMRDYLTDCPSTSFTLRNLGSRLPAWLTGHPNHSAPYTQLAIEMAQLEWAHIESFDNPAWPPLTPEQMASIGEDSILTLQPHLRLVEAHAAIDDALISLREDEGDSDSASNNASTGFSARRTRRMRTLPSEPVFLAIHRFDDSVYYRRLDPEDFRLLKAIRSGATLSQAIDAAFDNSAIAEQDRPAHLQSAFALFATLGWFCNQSAEDPL